MELKRKRIRCKEDFNVVTKYGVDHGCGDGYTRCISLYVESSAKENEYGILNYCINFMGRKFKGGVTPQNALFVLDHIVENMRHIMYNPEDSVTVFNMPEFDNQIKYFIDCKLDKEKGLYRFDVINATCEKVGDTSEGTIRETFYMRPEDFINMHNILDDLSGSIIVFNKSWVDITLYGANVQRCNINRRNESVKHLISLCTIIAHFYMSTNMIYAPIITILLFMIQLLALIGLRRR